MNQAAISLLVAAHVVNTLLVAAHVVNTLLVTVPVRGTRRIVLCLLPRMYHDPGGQESAAYRGCTTN